jgi:hypothetical protein
MQHPTTALDLCRASQQHSVAALVGRKHEECFAAARCLAMAMYRILRDVDDRALQFFTPLDRRLERQRYVASEKKLFGPCGASKLGILVLRVQECIKDIHQSSFRYLKFPLMRLEDIEREFTFPSEITDALHDAHYTHQTLCDEC